MEHKTPIGYIKAEFIEKSLRKIVNELDRLDKVDTSNEKEAFMLLLSSEGYRVATAINMSKNNVQAAKLLNVSERTLYRLRRKYIIND